MWLFKTSVKQLKKIIDSDTLITELSIIIIGEVENLNDMTIAELRILAKNKGISLQGKRIKSEIIALIEEQLK